MTRQEHCILDLYIEVLFLEQLLPADYTMTRLLLLLLSEAEPSASAEGHTEGNSPRHFYPLNMTCVTGYKRGPRPQLDASPFSFPINTAADGTSRAVLRGWLDGEAPDLSVGGVDVWPRHSLLMVALPGRTHYTAAC